MKAICVQARADSIVPSTSFAILRDPAEGPFGDPFRNNDEVFDFFIRSLHTDDLNAARLEGSPLRSVANVAPIGKSDLNLA